MTPLLGHHLVARAADPLQRAPHGGRRLHLDHQVDGPHVDAQFQRRGGDEGRQPTGFEVVLDLGARLPRDGAVMGPDQFLARQLVQCGREPLGERRLLTKSSVDRWAG